MTCWEAEKGLCLTALKLEYGAEVGEQRFVAISFTDISTLGLKEDSIKVNLGENIQAYIFWPPSKNCICLSVILIPCLLCMALVAQPSSLYALLGCSKYKTSHVQRCSGLILASSALQFWFWLHKLENHQPRRHMLDRIHSSTLLQACSRAGTH